MTTSTRIVVVDDHPLFREGVVRTLRGIADFDVVGEGTSADDAIRLAQEQLPDLILLDVSMPGGGIHAAERISADCPVVKIVMLTVSEHDDDVTAALRAGARGYILKGVGGTELIGIVRDVLSGEAYVSPDLAARLLADMGARPRGDTAERTLLADLTAREEQILKRVARGLSNKEIGLELNIQEKTVKHYMTNILQKLQVRNRVEAALLARNHLA
jgi:two-component system nitrate/nitrite response regulator NarL